MSDARIYSPSANEANLPLSSLASLHVTLVDAIKGYQTMMEKSQPELQASIQPFATLHQRHAEELAGILRESGISPDQDGSFMSAVHKVVVSARAMFNDLDNDALPSVVKGEELIVSEYRNVLAEAHDGNSHSALDRHHVLVQRLTKHIEDLTTLVRRAQAQMQV